ncbi:MAG: OmpH family outer membrane protein [Candidatus Faecousia sp.]|jgi:outer membrane protein|nr:OmpH family outer membrane protein [Candidatus Faecousia sp.]
MKKLPLIFSIIALAGVIAFAIADLTRGSKKPAAVETADASVLQGEIVYFDMDRVLQEYDLANDLRSVVETKVNSINQEVTRRQNKLQKDANAFSDKMNKGLITQSSAQVQYQKLQEQEASFNNYAQQKQQEILEEQNVMLNQISDAIKNFVDGYTAEMGYAMVLATQGAILPMPVVSAVAERDITDALIEGLNAAYVKEKGKKE